jgi:hypothetical protein
MGAPGPQQAVGTMARGFVASARERAKHSHVLDGMLDPTTPGRAFK